MILSLNMTNNHEIRREKIKRELDPNYRGFGNKEPSTTKLFGDQLQETIKTMGDSKVNLTINQTARKSFLGKRRGSEVIPPSLQPRLQLQQQQQPQQQQQQQQVLVPEAKSQVHKERSKQKVDPVSNQFSLFFKNTPDNFHAGKTANHVNSWTKVTQDRWILETISG